jgi:hypothetical protein
MGFDEKVDVIDLIINVLKEHEKSLDEIVTRLEGVISRAPHLNAAANQGVTVQQEPRRASISAVLRRWAEFRERCAGAGLVAFDIEGNQFKVAALKESVLYQYTEDIPDMEVRFKEGDDGAALDRIEISSVGVFPTVLRGRLECGLEVSVKGTEVKMPDGMAVYKVVYDVDTDGARGWLALQLKVEKRCIVQGRLMI